MSGHYAKGWNDGFKYAHSQGEAERCESFAWGVLFAIREIEEAQRLNPNEERLRSVLAEIRETLQARQLETLAEAKWKSSTLRPRKDEHDRPPR
jgi:hypothetical protein